MAELDLGSVVGPQGQQGIQGQTGPQGPAGPGVPTGGTDGQFLLKDGSTNYETKWGTVTGADLDVSGVDSTKISAALTSTNQAIANLAKTISSGSLHDIKSSGLYYLTNAVTDKPTSTGGSYIVGSNGNVVGGIFTQNTTGNTYAVRYDGSTWTYEQITLNSNFATVSGSFSSTIDTYVTVNYPTGFSADNCVVIGHMEKSTSGSWYSNNPSITVIADTINQIRIKTSEGVFQGQQFKIRLAKI